MKHAAHLLVLTGLLALPSARAAETTVFAPQAWLERHEVEIHGFLDARAGLRTQNDPTQRDVSLAEVRLQLDAVRYFPEFTVTARGDLLYDEVPSSHRVHLESGRGAFDLRELNVLFSPVPIVDLKIGRQILTWGTGDLLFINDLFPKDWVSFFIGRDEEYLKAPSDAVFASLFTGAVNLDLVYIPRFDADRFISGRRISYWDAALGRRAGRADVRAVDQPDDVFEDAEFAARASKLVGGFEWAAYAYSGYWKSPAGANPWNGAPNFPGLNVYGASVRGRLGAGIAYLEGGYLDSRRDRDGTDPFVRNSETRLLAGYQRELARDLSATVQYYLEQLAHHERYRRSQPPEATLRDEDRHVLTLRLTRMLMNQNLILNLFAFYSPSDQDAYLRPNIAYKASDAWLLTLGGNFFVGAKDQTFFGQFEDNNNVYAGIRRSF